MMENPDYYEFLQISPNADPETIHRVYRFLAARLHPDNLDTGDAQKFFLLTQAYDVLSHPERRAAYDATRKSEASAPPLSTFVDFMDDMEGESNRRLAVLAVLYFQRRANPYAPEVSLLDIERRMGFPRDYLEFTSWYLRNKGYITRADNSDFTLTVEGVDFVEAQRMKIPVLDKLLTTTTGTAAPGGAEATKRLTPPPTVIVPPPPAADVTDGNGASEGRGTSGDAQD